MLKIGIIAAMPAEFRCIPKNMRENALCVGVGSGSAERAAEKLMTKKIDLIISFGVAGALSPECATGSLLNVSKVIDFHREREFKAENLQRESLSSHHLISCREPVLTRTEKITLANRFHVHAVDMESSSIAAVASRHHCPFACLRTISDGADSALPPEIPALLADGGRPTLQLIQALCKRPPLLLELIQVGANYRRALKQLRHAAFELLTELQCASPNVVQE